MPAVPTICSSVTSGGSQGILRFGDLNLDLWQAKHVALSLCPHSITFFFPEFYLYSSLLMLFRWLVFICWKHHQKSMLATMWGSGEGHVEWSQQEGTDTIISHVIPHVGERGGQRSPGTMVDGSRHAALGCGGMKQCRVLCAWNPLMKCYPHNASILKSPVCNMVNHPSCVQSGQWVPDW